MAHTFSEATTPLQAATGTRRPPQQRPVLSDRVPEGVAAWRDMTAHSA